ncbi:hypothetical protein M431DRAFT_88073 [Trichoderma harzianum CBS 226.95]|uniref:Uncharacterized protein n=1 Tax=Trichoderma harzianum CBS 226.95 TaxID=983964 RepID=A0A2T4AAI4_TRIHA|nr:hypothetical protein M431DRAFT_88073 [Trichoderma harzianum CBS 226.95]PTB54095.1 hypothetical protein M431DRAFT_88073 [Trichoderma harzianum CBS 226.95]
MDKPTTLSRRELPKTTMIYIIVGVVVGLTCTVGVIVFLVIRHRKGQKYSQLRNRSTTATTNNNRESYRKSIMSTVSEVDDAQRQAMIRKSLATRSSMMTLNTMMTLNMDSSSVYTAPHPLDRTASHFLYQTTPETQEPHPPPSRDEESRDEESLIGLKADWKEWEARLHENQSLSLDLHPAIAPERKDSTGSNGSNGEYRLANGPPTRAHLSLITSELDRRSEPPMSRPNSVVSVKSNRSLPMKYDVRRDTRSPHQLQHSWTAS